MVWHWVKVLSKHQVIRVFFTSKLYYLLKISRMTSNVLFYWQRGLAWRFRHCFTCRTFIICFSLFWWTLNIFFISNMIFYLLKISRMVSIVLCYRQSKIVWRLRHHFVCKRFIFWFSLLMNIVHLFYF